jgi:hypothetical protein
VVNTPDTTHHSDADLQEVATHHNDALRVICPITDALNTIPALCAEIRQFANGSPRPSPTYTT